MRVFYSIKHSAVVYEEMTGKKGAVLQCTGYGHASEELAKALRKLGVEIVEEVEEASSCDIELYFGQPRYKPEPTIHPSVLLTMTEFEGVPSDWIGGLVNYDYILTPSQWNRGVLENVLRKAGVEKRIDVIPLGFNPGKFPPMYRPADRSPWTYLWMGDTPMGRKGCRYVMDAFQSLNLPNSRLVLKMLPTKTSAKEATFVIPSVAEQKWKDIIFLYQQYDWNEMRQLLWNADVSVYPSEGEGFGLIPLEHMAVGLYCIFTNYSGLADLADPEFNRPIGWSRKKCLYAPGADALPSTEDLKKAMLWVYEHKEEAREMGQRASLWVRERWTWDQVAKGYLQYLESILEVQNEV